MATVHTRTSRYADGSPGLLLRNNSLMSDAAHSVFARLQTYADCLGLVNDGETEGLYLECKAPSAPHLSKSQKAQLAEALSGFANSAGGVILWGASTTRHSHSGLDVISAIEPVGAVKTFARAIEATIPTLTTPPLLGTETKAILEDPKKKRGVVVTLVPQSQGDPIQSTHDNRFHFRSGDQFTTLPYELLKRMFAASESPDLSPQLDERRVSQEKDGIWRIPITIANASSAIGEYPIMSVEVLNPDACETVVSRIPLMNVSTYNPGKTLFMTNLGGVIHRGISQSAGELLVKMRGRRRSLKLRLELYANHMQARRYDFGLSLAKNSFSVTVDRYELI